MGIGDDIKGKAKEMAGKVTGDENQELEGEKLQQASDDDDERSTTEGDSSIQQDAATTTERKTLD
jgi:hypothetical protein